MVGPGRNFESLESVDVATEVKDIAVEQGLTVFGEEGELGFGILNPQTKERYYYMEGRLFREDEMPEEGLLVDDIANVRVAVMKKLDINSQI